MQNQLVQTPAIAISSGAQRSIARYSKQPRQDRSLLLRCLKADVLDPATPSDSYESYASMGAATSQLPSSQHSSTSTASSSPPARAAASDTAANASQQPSRSATAELASALRAASNGTQSAAPSGFIDPAISPIYPPLSDVLQPAARTAASSRVADTDAGVDREPTTPSPPKPFHASLNNRVDSAQDAPDTASMRSRARARSTAQLWQDTPPRVAVSSDTREEAVAVTSEEADEPKATVVLSQKRGKGMPPRTASTVASSQHDSALDSGARAGAVATAERPVQMHNGQERVAAIAADTYDGNAASGSRWGWPVTGASQAPAGVSIYQFHYQHTEEESERLQVGRTAASTIESPAAPAPTEVPPSSSRDEDIATPAHLRGSDDVDPTVHPAQNHVTYSGGREVSNGHAPLQSAPTGAATPPPPPLPPTPSPAAPPSALPAYRSSYDAQERGNTASSDSYATANASSTMSADRTATASSGTFKPELPSLAARQALIEGCVPYKDGDEWHCQHLFAPAGGRVRDGLVVSAPVFRYDVPRHFAGASRYFAPASGQSVTPICLVLLQHSSRSRSGAHLIDRPYTIRLDMPLRLLSFRLPLPTRLACGMSFKRICSPSAIALPGATRFNCNKPGSTSGPGAATTSTPHSALIAASVALPT